MVCCEEGISKYIMIGLNILFMVLGLAVMVPGIVMLTNIDFLSGNIEPLLDKITFNGLNLSNIANNLPIIFIIVGGSILFIAVLGLVGACCKLKTFLVLYALIVIVLALVQVIILAFFFLLRTQLNDTIKGEFVNQLQTNYKQDDLDKSDEVSSAFNYMFMQMECCGINPVTGTTNDFEGTPWKTGAGSTLKIPKGCCIGVTEDTYSTFVNMACTNTATTGSYHSDGCFDVIMSSFGTTLDLMGYICLGALLMQILMVIFAFCLCCTYMKSGSFGVKV